MPKYEVTTSGTGRQNHRITIDGTLQRTPQGRVAIYSEAGARKALAQLEHAPREEAAPGSPREATEQGQPLTVLNTARRRMDGLTHEEAAARFSPPAPILCVVSTRRQIVLLQGRTRGSYTLDASGHVVAVEIAELDSKGTLYSGTLEALQGAGTKTKHAVKLAQWRRIGYDALARHTPPQGS